MKGFAVKHLTTYSTVSKLCLVALLILATAHGEAENQPTLASVAPSPKVSGETARENLRIDPHVQLCQALGPAAPYDIRGVDCADGNCGDGRGGDGRGGDGRSADGRSGKVGWDATTTIPWQAFAQGEYVGHPRTRHVPEYRLRVDDQIEFRYRETRDQVNDPTQLSVGDQLKIESFTDEKLNREVNIQQDGTITVPLLGRVPATRRTAPQLRDDLEDRYKKYVKIPAITVTPLKTNTKLKDLLDVVDARYGAGGQALTIRITPDGTIALPGIGSSVPAQGLTLDELRKEIEQRYLNVANIVGVEVTPSLSTRAPRFVYVLGEVQLPGRFELTGPTTVMQAIALAGSWNIGGELKQIVVFRRGDDWRLMATKIDIRGALFGRTPCPAGEIWLNDSDVIVVPKNAIQAADDWIELIFTRGIYGVIPFQGITLNFSKLSSI